MISARGINGQVTFDGIFVTLTRSTSTKRIPVGSITAVQWKEPGGFWSNANAMNGLIEFTLPGANEQQRNADYYTHTSWLDENSCQFTKKQAPQFAPLREAIEAAIVTRYEPQQPAAPQASKLDELRQLGELRDAGVLSDAEFDTEKARILASTAAPGVATTAVPPIPAPVASPVPPTPGTGRRKAGRIAAAVSTGGLSEVGFFAKKKFDDRKQA